MNETLIDASRLNGLVGRDDVLIVDCRSELGDAQRGPRDYAEGHIPGAVHAVLDRDLSDLSKRGLGRHPLPDAAAFSHVLANWGWTPDTFVVAYDTANGALAAARLWWMLRIAGQRKTAVLDGGLAAWKNAGLALSAAPFEAQPTAVSIQFDAAQIVYSDELQRDADDLLLLDGRAAPRVRGEVEPIDPVAGHVPGAKNRPFSDNLEPSGMFKPASALRRDFAAVIGARDPRTVVHMCGSGVTACHNLLAMEHAALAGSRIYAPSWSGWIADPQRPIARGEI
jgi:thiosulfate/3-mercaptopyruvate sulfurtransferase